MLTLTCQPRKVDSPTIVIDLAEIGATEASRHAEPRSRVHNLNDGSFVIRYSGPAPTQLTISGNFVTQAPTTDLGESANDEACAYCQLQKTVGEFVSLSEGPIEGGAAFVASLNDRMTMRGDGSVAIQWDLKMLLEDSAEP